jgi:hypothetical protein
VKSDLVPLKQWAIEQRPDIPARSAHMNALRLAKTGKLPEAIIVDTSALRRSYMIPQSTKWRHYKRGPADTVQCPLCGGLYHRTTKERVAI